MTWQRSLPKAVWTSDQTANRPMKKLCLISIFLFCAVGVNAQARQAKPPPFFKQGMRFDNGMKLVKNILLTSVTCFLLTLGVHAQCVGSATDPCVEIHQSVLDRAAKNANRPTGTTEADLDAKLRALGE